MATISGRLSPKKHRTRVLILAGLVGLMSWSAQSATAGPIAEGFSRWSAQRQSRATADKPFSGQSSNVDMGSHSLMQRLRSRLSSKPVSGTNSYKMTTQTFHHDQGILVR